MTVVDAPVSIPPILRYAIPAFSILILAEAIFLIITKRTRYSIRDSLASITVGLVSRASGVAFGGLAFATYLMVYEHRLLHLNWTWPVMVACFFAEDLAYYWFHRVSHERRWFWASHVVHHSSQHYNLSTAVRQTWTGVPGLAFIFWLPLVFIGFPPLMMVMFSTISLVYQFWIHTELIGRLGSLEKVLNTPSHHRVHHATNARYLDANYAGVLIIWDRLFGTFVPEDHQEKPRYGIISPLDTFNPLRIAFHEWASLLRDVRRANCLTDLRNYIFGVPGWSPDGSRATSKSIKAAWIEQQERRIGTSDGLRARSSSAGP